MNDATNLKKAISSKLMDRATRKKIMAWARTPHAKAINVEFQDLSPHLAHSKAAYNSALARSEPDGPLHSGVITVMLDETGSHAAQFELDAIKPLATIDLRIDHLQSPRPGADIHTKAECYKVTPSVAFVRASAYHERGDGEEETLSAATITYMVGAHDKNMYRGAQLKDDLKDSAAPEIVKAAADSNAFVHDPYARFLGVEETENNGLALRYAPKLIGNPALPALHGGVIGAFMEIAAQHEVARRAAPARPAPISLTFNYLRTGKAMDAFAASKIVKLGKRIVTVETQVWQDNPDQPIALAYGHFLLLDDAAP